LNLRPLPDGAEPGEWEIDGGTRYRILRGKPRGIAERSDVSIFSSAVQFDHGRTDNAGAIQKPRVFLQLVNDGLAAQQAVRGRRAPRRCSGRTRYMDRQIADAYTRGEIDLEALKAAVFDRDGSPWGGWQ
jgi:hypothetical protein